jgi:hypothetical protein
MTLTNTTTERRYSDGSELIPAEVAVREQREGSEPPNEPLPKIQQEEVDSPVNTTGGYTVDQEGLVNNYATPPETYKADYPTPKQQSRYLFWGLIAFLFVAGLIGLSFTLS